jgi:protein SCO1/2
MRTEAVERSMSRGFLIVLAVLALAFAGITGLAIRNGVLGGAGGSQQTAAIGGAFHLVDQTGRPATDSVLKGKWSAVFFGYTNCPDACPTTLFALAGAEKQLGPQADFQTVFITVDPQRDTTAKLASYLTNPAFPRRSIGLTGTPQQVAEAAKAYKVFYQLTPDAADPKSYTVNHSTFTYLMTPKGRFACVIPYDASPDQIAGHVRAAMKQGDGATSC